MSRAIWAIGDLHLSFGTPNKEMDRFGPSWVNHAEKIKTAWDAKVAPNDIVLIPGDISWAMRQEQVMPDLTWVHERPGTKVLIRGNHDYWWGSASKVRSFMPKTIHILHNDAVVIDDIAIAGTRLWDSSEFSLESLIDRKGSVEPGPHPDEKNDEEIFQRELHRLELSLKQLPKEASCKIAMTHYPPIGLDLAPSKASALFEQYGVSLVVFGHLHSLKTSSTPLFGTARGITYVLCSCDYIDFAPLFIRRY